MDDITPRTPPLADGRLPDSNLRGAIPVQPASPPQDLQPPIEGQALRPVPRRDFRLNDVVGSGNRPMSRPVARPMVSPRPLQRPNQNSTDYPPSGLSRQANNLSPSLPRTAVPTTQPNSVYPQQLPPLPQQPQYQPPMPSQPAPQYRQPVPSQPITQPGTVKPHIPSVVPQTKTGKSKKDKLRLGLKTGLAAIMLLSVTQLFSWYATHYLSVYNKLVAAHYSNSKGVSFSLIHPAALNYDSSITKELKFTPAAYSYNINAKEEVLIDVRYNPIKTTLHNLHLTPGELLSQLKSNAGSYVDYLNKTDPGTYENCNNFVSTASGSDLVCTINGTNGTITHVVGVTSTYFYSLNLYVPKSIWSMHQNIWQKVEKSFSVQ